MKLINIIPIILFLSTASVHAAPKFLITHNNTNEESNAFIEEVPSAYPTKAKETAQVGWNLVKFACYGHIVNDECKAIIKMATNTPNPITLGEVKLNLTTGEITPARLSKNGYTITVNSPGETTLSYE